MEFVVDFLMLHPFILLQQGRPGDIIIYLIITKMISPVKEENFPR